MSTTQVLFAIALGTITLVITGFALYALSSTMWSGRWYPPDDVARPLAPPAPPGRPGEPGEPVSR